MLTWSSTATLMGTVADRDWLIPPGYGLWVPGGIPHAGAVLHAGEMLTITFAADRCPITWTGPTCFTVGSLLGEIISYLHDLAPDDHTRPAAETLMFQLLTPLPAHHIHVTLPTDPGPGRSPSSSSPIPTTSANSPRGPTTSTPASAPSPGCSVLRPASPSRPGAPRSGSGPPSPCWPRAYRSTPPPERSATASPAPSSPRSAGSPGRLRGRTCPNYARASSKILPERGFDILQKSGERVQGIRTPCEEKEGNSDVRDDTRRMVRTNDWPSQSLRKSPHRVISQRFCGFGCSSPAIRGLSSPPPSVAR